MPGFALNPEENTEPDGSSNDVLQLQLGVCSTSVTLRVGPQRYAFPALSEAIGLLMAAADADESEDGSSSGGGGSAAGAAAAGVGGGAAGAGTAAAGGGGAGAGGGAGETCASNDGGSWDELNGKGAGDDDDDDDGGGGGGMFGVSTSLLFGDADDADDDDFDAGDGGGMFSSDDGKGTSSRLFGNLDDDDACSLEANAKAAAAARAFVQLLDVRLRKYVNFNPDHQQQHSGVAAASSLPLATTADHADAAGKREAASIVVKAERRVLSFYRTCASAIASALLPSTAAALPKAQSEREGLPQPASGSTTTTTTTTTTDAAEAGDEKLAAEVVAVYMKIKHGM